MKLSVIVPVYNAEKTLERCLKSILCSKNYNFEVICINDGSFDNSRAILENYSKMFHALKVIHTTNQGLSSARNVGLQVARGQYIGFVDSDDFIEEGMFDLLIQEMESSFVDLAGCGTNLIYNDNLSQRLNDVEYFSVKLAKAVKVQDGIFSQMDVHVWNKLFRREIIEEFDIKFPAGLNYEDAPFLLIFLSVSNKISFIDEKLYNYVRSSDSIMGRTFKKTPRALDLIKVVDFCYSVLKELNIDKRLRVDFIDYFIRNSILAFKYSPRCYYFDWFKLFLLSLVKIGFYNSFLVLIRFNVKLFKKIIGNV